LPRAQLKEAIEKPDVAERITAISAVGAGKLIPAVRREVDAALKVALHAAFEKASAAGTVSALRDFQKTYPQAEDVPAAKTKIHLLRRRLATPRALLSSTLLPHRPKSWQPRSAPRRLSKPSPPYGAPSESPPASSSLASGTSRSADSVARVRR